MQRGWLIRAMRGMAPCLAGALAALAAAPAGAAQFALADGAPAVGTMAAYVTTEADTLLDVARRHDLGFTQLMAANPGVDAWIPGAGRRLTLPSFYLLPNAPRQGIVINLAEQRLFYFPRSGGMVETFPIGTGVDRGMTPLGVTRIVRKEVAPAWYPPPSIRAAEPDLPKVVPPGPDNPLGAYALVLAWPDYLIHGTDKPDGVGRNVSHGCIRLYPEDIAALSREVPVGTPVRVVDQPVELGWIGNDLYLEVHPSEQQAEALDIGGSLMPAMPPDLVARVVAAAGDRSARIDWAAVRRAGLERSGIPVRIATAPPPHIASAS